MPGEEKIQEIDKTDFYIIVICTYVLGKEINFFCVFWTRIEIECDGEQYSFVELHSQLTINLKRLLIKLEYEW